MSIHNTALLRLMKSIEQELAIRTEQHVGYQPLPISEHTGEPYDPEWGYCYLGPNHARPKRKFRLFRRREKPRPKQEHVSLFEVLPDGPYVGCERCYLFQQQYPDTKLDVHTELFYEKKSERAHAVFYHGGIVDKRLISEDSR